MKASKIRVNIKMYRPPFNNEDIDIEKFIKNCVQVSVKTVYDKETINSGEKKKNINFW